MESPQSCFLLDGIAGQRTHSHRRFTRSPFLGVFPPWRGVCNHQSAGPLFCERQAQPQGGFGSHRGSPCPAWPFVGPSYWFLHFIWIILPKPGQNVLNRMHRDRGFGKTYIGSITHSRRDLSDSGAAGPTVHGRLQQGGRAVAVARARGSEPGPQVEAS